MLPSSLIISIRAAAGNRPARRAKSTAASVCPARCSTPRSCAYSGLMCPGRPNVSGVASGSASARMVLARSCMLTPVEHPSSLSTVTVKGVPSTDVLSSTCLGSPSSSQRFIVIGTQSTPRAILSMKFTCSGVIFSAATMSSIASSMRSSLIFSLIFVSVKAGFG